MVRWLYLQVGKSQRKTRAGEKQIVQLVSYINAFAHTVPDCFGSCNVQSLLQRKAHQPITCKQLYEFREVNGVNYFRS